MFNLKLIPTTLVTPYKDILELDIFGYSTEEREIDLSLKIENNYKTFTIKLYPNRINRISINIDNLCNKETCEIYAFSEGKILDVASYFTNITNDVERIVALVWHNHQAPGKYPNNKYKYIWSIIYTIRDILHPYGKGPYTYHTQILERYENYKATFNLSPSLLEQWINLIENGIFYEGGFISKDSLEARIVSETLEKYKKAYNRGQIDILTSVYAHTILGYLLEKNLDDILIKEIEYGMEITKSVFKREPKGIWTSEMASNMNLVSIYKNLGLEYTILDSRCHLQGKYSNLKPYIVKNKDSEIFVFFRDTELSNILSFDNNFPSELESIKKAYDFTYLILNRLKNGGVLTIALDGENWIIFSKKPPLVALFYDSLINNLVKLQKGNYLRMSNLLEILKTYPNPDEIHEIPTTSWLCSWGKWCNEKEEQKKYWKIAFDLYQRYLKIKEYLDYEKRKEIEYSFWHIFDSDYWWSDFWDEELILSWIKYVEDKLNNTLHFYLKT